MNPPTFGPVSLREVREDDVTMAQALSTDPYVSATGTLPRNASREQALDWVARQRQRHTQGRGFSFTIVETAAGRAVGHCGLWLRELSEGRATAGYSIAPTARGRGLATSAFLVLTTFGWTLPGLSRIALLIEPWNAASIRPD